MAGRPLGKALQALDIDVNEYPVLDVTQLSNEDLDALVAIFDRYVPDAAELAEAGALKVGARPVGASSRRNSRS
jgi:hypothetical protein